MKMRLRLVIAARHRGRRAVANPSRAQLASTLATAEPTPLRISRSRASTFCWPVSASHARNVRDLAVSVVIDDSSAETERTRCIEAASMSATSMYAYEAKYPFEYSPVFDVLQRPARVDVEPQAGELAHARRPVCKREGGIVAALGHQHELSHLVLAQQLGERFAHRSRLGAVRREPLLQREQPCVADRELQDLRGRAQTQDRLLDRGRRCLVEHGLRDRMALALVRADARAGLAAPHHDAELVADQRENRVRGRRCRGTGGSRLRARARGARPSATSESTATTNPNLLFISSSRQLGSAGKSSANA